MCYTYTTKKNYCGLISRVVMVNAEWKMFTLSFFFFKVYFWERGQRWKFYYCYLKYWLVWQWLLLISRKYTYIHLNVGQETNSINTKLILSGWRLMSFNFRYKFHQHGILICINKWQSKINYMHCEMCTLIDWKLINFFITIMDNNFNFIF